MENDITLNSDILVIDDSAVVLNVVKRILDDKYHVRIAQSAKVAYALLEKKIPDLILLDLEMPEIDGFVFLESITGNPAWKEIPVIFLTGVDDRKKEEQALELGAVEYLLKPISEGILLKRVHFHLELRKYQEKLEELVESRTEELMKTQKELQEAAEIANVALRVKSTFLANMSHEIRTPMNSIMGFAELALDSNISEDTRISLLKIKDSTVLLLRIINDILDISKIEAGKLELECVSFCPGNVLMNCRTMIVQQVAEKKLEFYMNIDEQLTKKQLLGDPVRLYQAILNLLANAVKFTKTGGISLSASLVSSSNDIAFVRFEVEDSGIGMTEEQLSLVFDPFAQLDSEFTRINDGSGLGLPITKNIVELMGGELRVESVPGVGSKFIIEANFPITDEVSLFDDVFGPTESEYVEKPLFNGEVLVCEDNRMNQQVICEHLKRVGLDSIVAENGLEGLNVVMRRMKRKEKLFDLILMDMQMPVMDGYEATAKINALGTGIPIIALTANVMTTDIENYKRNGFMDCLGKPFQTWDLWRCLLSFLEPLSKVAVDEDPFSKTDEELRQKLLTDFPVENRDRIANIKIAIEEGDLKSARLHAHTLKSNAGLIGEFRLQELAAAVEAKIEAGDVQDIRPHMALLENELKMALNKLEFIRIKSGGNQQPVDLKEGFAIDVSSDDDSKKRVFIADDEKSNIIALTHILKDEYNVFITRDGRDVAEAVERHKPDIILLDILMPDMDGYEVITALKGSEKTKDIPVIFISGLSSPEAIEKGLALGASDYITKPFDASMIKTRVRIVLEGL